MNKQLKDFWIKCLKCILLSFYPVTYLFCENNNNLDLIQIVIPLIIVASVSLVLYITLFKFRINNLEISIPIILIVLFNYQRIYLFIIAVFNFQNIIRHRYLISFILLFCILIIYFISKKLNYNSIVFLRNFLIVINLIPFFFVFKSFNYNSENVFYQNIVQSQRIEEKGPNIYFIILDMYPSNKVLKNVFKFDNYDFQNELRKIGFNIFENSLTNYNRTLLSISSTLNMEYHNLNLLKSLNQNSFEYLHKQIDNNRISKILIKEGYEYYYYDGGYFRLNKISNNRFYLSYSNNNGLLNSFNSSDNNFFLLFVNLSFLSPFSEKIKLISTDVYRAKINYVFNSLPSIVNKTNKKKFIVSHLISPHPPYLFGENGEKIYFDENCVDEKEKIY